MLFFPMYLIYTL